MITSPNNPTKILNLIKLSLSNDTNNREIIMKGIDYSYYYEQIYEY